MDRITSQQFEKFGDTLKYLLDVLPDDDAITDTFDYALGAFYGLVKAHELNFQDRSGVHFFVYRPYLSLYAQRISKNDPLDETWQAGFFFNSALQRLASAFDRIPKMLGAKMTTRENGKLRGTTAEERMKEVNIIGKWDRWKMVYKEVNVLKHEPAGRATGRVVTMIDAIAAFAEMVQLLSAKKDALIQKYPRKVRP